MQFDLNINPLDRVIAGFPGVGKSYLFKGNSEQYADSDSSTFDKSDFPANYMRHIAELLGSTDKTMLENIQKKVLSEVAVALDISMSATIQRAEELVLQP